MRPNLYIPPALRFGPWLLLLLFILSGCGANQENTSSTPDTTARLSATDGSLQQPVVPVETQTVTPSTFEDVVQVTGTVKAMNDAIISAETSGRVEMLAGLGAYVTKNQVVARINDRLLEAAFQAAQAQYQLAQETFERQKALRADSIISALEYDNAKAQLDQAKAQFEQAQEQLANARPRSPFSGRIEEQLVEEGEFVSPGSPLIRVVNTRHVKLTAGVPERYINDIRQGTAVTARFRTRGVGQRRGTVTFAGRTINPSSRTFSVEVALDNRQEELSPEMIADLYITRDVLEKALVVPQAAIVRDEETTSVYTVTVRGDQPVANRQEVTLGPTANGQTVIRSGLQPGARVIVNGNTQVTNGDPVQLLSESPS